MPLASYMPAIERLTKAVGYRSIFIATDSAEVIKNTTQYPQYKWMYRNIDRSRFDVYKKKKVGKNPRRALV